MAYAAEAFDLEDLTVGQHAEFETVIADGDIDRFATLSGDESPLHVDKAFARNRGYADRVAHGAYLVALASRLVGMYMPGRNALLLAVQVSFVAPALSGARVKVRGEVEQLSDSVRSVVLKLTIHDIANEALLARGRLTVGFTTDG
ncbi:MAG TPA: MaoC/PaaZ C-terminal domain-containing protein [Rhodanobacteraceae bacterium]|jgi:3-hydroxybutyryl-CoA dehydratase|nr:MaoC/PaaZ C-terminal domain-containing protein [Rhodanobacteraceae bacterium]